MWEEFELHDRSGRPRKWLTHPMAKKLSGFEK